MKKHIVFDFDDTITSAYELNQKLFVDTFTSYQSDVDKDFLRKLHFDRRGTSISLQFQEAIDKFGLQVKVEQLVKENELLHQKSAEIVNIFDGIGDLFKHFKSRKKVVSICTNRARGSLEIILKKHGLYQYLDNIISFSDEKHEKPDPFCLIGLIAKYQNITKGETIYFGDSKTDSEFATNAGIDFIVVDHYLNKKLYYQLILESFADSEETSLFKR